MAACATCMAFDVLLRLSDSAGENCVTGRRLRRGATDLGRDVLLLVRSLSGGGVGKLRGTAAFSLSVGGGIVHYFLAAI